MSARQMIFVSKNQRWSIRTRKGWIGLTAVVSHSASVKKIFTGVGAVSRAISYAKKQARVNGDEVLVRRRAIT